MSLHLFFVLKPCASNVNDGSIKVLLLDAMLDVAQYTMIDTLVEVR